MIDRLAQRVGGGVLGAAAPRLRCETCSTPPASVELADGYSGMAWAIAQMTLAEQS